MQELRSRDLFRKAMRAMPTSIVSEHQRRLREEPAVPNSLVMNLFPTTFSGDTARVWAGKWESPEHADALRASIPGLMTWRDRDDGARLYAWDPQRTLKSGPPGFQQVTVTLDESPPLFQRLLSDAIDRRFAELGFTAKGDGFVNYARRSLVAEIPALSATANERIGIYAKIVRSVFFTRTASDELVLGPVLDILYTTRLDLTAAEWAAAGLTEEIREKYVVLVAGSPEAAKYPELVNRTIGRIDGVRGDRCILADPRERALVELHLASVAPEPSRHNLAAYLAARYKQAYAANERRLTDRLRSLIRPVERHRLATAAASRLQQDRSGRTKELEILPGLTARLESMARMGPDDFPVRRLSSPTYSFDRAGKKFQSRVDAGLRQHGPYDLYRARHEPVRFLVVAPRENQGEVEVAVQKLLSGVNVRDGVFIGMRKMFRMPNIHPSYSFADTALMASYSEAVNRAIAAAPGNTPKFDLILTVIRESHRLLPDGENPYFQTKALALITEGIPTQAITIEKLRFRDEQLQYVLNTLSVACYAKLGGTSHVLRLPEEGDGPTELLFGVGRSVIRSARFATAEETIGFATVFRANGEYLYNDCTPYCESADYERALEATIRRTVERVAAFEQLSDGAPLRLIFHVPRRPGKREERAILNAVGKLPRFDITFAILHVNDDHEIQLFDTSKARPVSWGRPKPEAALLPARGLSVAIGPRERLVTFIGADQYRGNGCPAPLRVTLDRRSTFTDLEYLTQQLYHLSFMSARTLNPGVAPVTVSYAEQIARLTGHLRSVQKWTVDLIQQKLGRRLWFI